MPIKAVLFDVGDTLVYEHEDWRELEREGVERLLLILHGHGVTLEEDRLQEVLLRIREQNFVRARESGKEVTAAESIATALKELGAKGVSRELISRCVEAYFHPEEERSRLLPGVEEGLRTLAHRGFQLGVVSNATSALAVRRILEMHGILHWFRACIVSAEVGYRKPRREIFQLALSGVGAKASEAVFVGDRPDIDIKGAHDAGLRTIMLKAVKQTPLTEAAHADWVASSFAEAVEVLIKETEKQGDQAR
ncbi:MAG: HAD family hydrolase [candidate division KSB1 bacterium]|nr:HAD family hydrolase [candidate division KSB1 bacterium]MDZ7295732.1 HAD family hydrolase [candidate division KSB1 bacterium]MDZ7384659.1 HAD family hydrolase [candidate division KSB1 bacterium]